MSKTPTTKRIVIVHGWQGTPESNWFPWLKRELEQLGHEVFVPQLPDTNNPKIDPWVGQLDRVIGTADSDTYFVTHSLGCQAVLRYLEMLPTKTRIGGTVFVAGFLQPPTPPEGVWHDGGEMVRHWTTKTLDLSKIKNIMPRSTAIFSDNDPWVPLTNTELFKQELQSKIIVEHAASHFNTSDGFTELPVALKELLLLIK